MRSTVDITLRDGIAYLTVGDSSLSEAIVDATSFKPEGADYWMPAQADKRKKLVRNGKCPLGLLDRVCRVIVEAGFEPVLTKASSMQAQKPPLVVRLQANLRDYQREALLATAFEDRGIIRAPTGSGKTIIGAAVIAAKACHAVVLVPTIDLLHQYREHLAQHLELAPIGQLGGGVVDPQPVTVATIRTMAKVLSVAYESYEFAEYDDSDPTEVDPKALRAWVQRIGTLIVDEAHILGAQTVYEVANKVSAPYKYGFSASPWRDDGADLMIEAATGPLIYRVEVGRLIDGGHLLAPEIATVDTASWWRSGAWGSVCVKCGTQKVGWSGGRKCTNCGGQSFRSQFPQAYKQEIVENQLRNGKIAGIVNAVASEEWPALVLVKQVKHGRDLAARIPRARFLSGRDDGAERKRVFDAVRNGQCPAIVCTTIADMGLDIPNLSSLVLAGGGKSSVRHLQRIGRVVRPAPGKPRPLVVDFDDGHIHRWFADHYRARRRIEREEWRNYAQWRTGLK